MTALGQLGSVAPVVIPGHGGAACAGQVLALEQRPRALQRHNQRDENDEGQVDQLIAGMGVNEQQHTEPELGRVGKQRDGQHNPVSASVQPVLEPDDRDDANHGHDHGGLADVDLGDEPEQGHHKRVHQARESSDRQRFATRHGIRPEDRVVSDRNSHKQQADERRSRRGHRAR